MVTQKNSSLQHDYSLLLPEKKSKLWDRLYRVAWIIWYHSSLISLFPASLPHERIDFVELKVRSAASAMVDIHIDTEPIDIDAILKTYV